MTLGANIPSMKPLPWKKRPEEKKKLLKGAITQSDWERKTFAKRFQEDK